MLEFKLYYFEVRRMFPLGIVHSVIHTLLLALSASGRSGYPHGAYAHEYLFADPRISIAFALPHVQNSSAHAEQLAESPSIRIIAIPRAQELVQELVQERTSAVVVANTSSRKAWTLDVNRRNTFLGMPAYTVLARHFLGTSITKIRKIFTVRKNNITHDEISLSCSTPPDDYDSLLASI